MAVGRTAAELTEGLLAGDKRALARAISLVENDDPEGWALVREIYPKTGKAAVVDAPLGAGHVVLFAIRPMWRHESQGTFALVLNAMANWNRLDAGRRGGASGARPVAATGAAATAGEGAR